MLRYLPVKLLFFDNIIMCLIKQNFVKLSFLFRKILLCIMNQESDIECFFFIKGHKHIHLNVQLFLYKLMNDIKKCFKI